MCCTGILRFCVVCVVWVFLGKGFEKTIAIFQNEHTQTCLFAKLYEKLKMPKFWTKKPDLGIFALQFENNFVIFEISTLEFFQLQNFEKKQKWLNLGRKMPCFGGVFLTKNGLYGYF